MRGRINKRIKEPKSKLLSLDFDFYSVLENLNEGFSIQKIIFDKTGNPFDFLYLYVNDAFSKILNLENKNIVGNRHSEMSYGFDHRILDFYEHVISDNKPNTFEYFSNQYNKRYRISVFKINKETLATTYTEIIDTEKEKEKNQSLFNLDVQKDFSLAREKIRNFYEEIEIQNKKLKTANDELELRNVKLEEANKKALESEKLKSVFLENISHEIRTPLNGILGFSQLLAKTKCTPEVMTEYADIISLSGDQLIQTINNILDISKIETQQLEVQFSTCSVSAILNDVYNFNKHYIKDANEIKFYVSEDSLTFNEEIYCDGVKVKQILNILINNAIKFTSKGFIKIGYKPKDDDNFLFYISDSGIGIEKEECNFIFDQFRQSDESSTRKYRGTGLGLAIAKGLIDILDGEIWFDSNPEDLHADMQKNALGTTFYFTIPNSINTEKQCKIMDIKNINLIDWSNRKVLIVEDDQYNIDYLTVVLADTKVKIEISKDGKDAIQKVKDNKDLDLVLMDIQLPFISGDKATSLIREFNLDIPIIAQTAHAMMDDRENYIKAGCTDYISKPIAIDELFSVLCRYI